ncbi:MAG: 2-hydroxyacid dehydrogenase [Alphaproteobacteria bacterium]|nr:2-hydroxyacid dehydrogenase [Alphaproteobacteria bacterium]
MKHDILAMAPIPAAQMAQLEDSYTVHKLWKSKDPEALLNDVKDSITGMVSVYGQPVSARLIKALPNLEIIAHYGVGYDNIDIEAARAQEIIVTNTPDVLTDDTADIAMGLVLGVMRRMVEGDIYVRTGQWAKKGDLPLGRCLRGKTMGIVGLGRIGQAVAKRAEAFGMKVVWHGPRAKKGISWPHYNDLMNMVEITDILMLTCLYSPETHHFIDSAVLKALGHQGVLVNVARGKVVNEDDLVEALENVDIAGAGLDVYENEPDVPSALCRLDNVVLQPHQGSATHETRGAMAQMVVDNLRLYFEKVEVLTAV